MKIVNHVKLVNINRSETYNPGENIVHSKTIEPSGTSDSSNDILIRSRIAVVKLRQGLSEKEKNCPTQESLLVPINLKSSCQS